jgi:hypothetical protein
VGGMMAKKATEEFEAQVERSEYPDHRLLKITFPKTLNLRGGDSIGYRYELNESGDLVARVRVTRADGEDWGVLTREEEGGRVE